jgi:hypothetical protein
MTGSLWTVECITYTFDGSAGYSSPVYVSVEPFQCCGNQIHVAIQAAMRPHVYDKDKKFLGRAAH